jgi:hypothetical protein
MGAPQNVIGKLGMTSGGGRILSYPSDIFNSPFACVLRFSEYNREISYSQGSQNPIGSIVLPLPLQISDNTNVNHSTFEAPVIAGLAQAYQSRKAGESLADVVGRVAKGNIGLLANKGVEALGGMAARLGGILDSATNVAGVNLGTAQLGQEIAAAGKAGAFTGQILNPHLTVLFSGVDLRTFAYTWNLMPRSLDESKNINEIINYIKRCSLPSYTEGRVGLKFPKEVQVDFVGSGIEEFIFGTKRTVILSVDVGYTPSGHPTMFKSGAPVGLSLSITLKEVSIRTAEDYGQLSESAYNEKR